MYLCNNHSCKSQTPIDRAKNLDILISHIKINLPLWANVCIKLNPGFQEQHTSHSEHQTQPTGQVIKN